MNLSAAGIKGMACQALPGFLSDQPPPPSLLRKNWPLADANQYNAPLVNSAAC